MCLSVRVHAHAHDAGFRECNAILHLISRRVQFPSHPCHFISFHPINRFHPKLPIPSTYPPHVIRTHSLASQSTECSLSTSTPLPANAHCRFADDRSHHMASGGSGHAALVILDFYFEYLRKVRKYTLKYLLIRRGKKFTPLSLLARSMPLTHKALSLSLSHLMSAAF